MRLSVIVPAYNEEKIIEDSLTGYLSYLDKQDYESELIVVNDGSSDRTALIVKKLIAGRPDRRLKLITFEQNQGKGAAVRAGLLSGTGAYRLFLDADGSTPIKYTDDIWPAFKENYELVIASRNGKDASGAVQDKPQNFLKRNAGKFGNLIIRLLLVQNIRDTQCGFKAFTAKAINELAAKTRVNGWAFDIEILALAQRCGYPVKILPVVWRNNPDSKVRATGYFLTLIEALKIKYNLLTKKYD